MEASQIINVTSQIHSHLHYYWSCPKHPGAVLSTHTHTTCHTYSQSFQNLVNKITLTTSTSDQLLIFCTDLWPSWWRGPPPCHPWPAPRPLCASVPDHCCGRCYVPSGCWPPVQTPPSTSAIINNTSTTVNTWSTGTLKTSTEPSVIWNRTRPWAPILNGPSESNNKANSNPDLIHPL